MFQKLAGLISLLGIVAFLAFVGLRKERPRILLLTAATNNWSSRAVIIPKGHNFNLVFGVKKGEMPPLTSDSGRIVIGNAGREPFTFAFRLSNSTPGSWLSHENLDAYILTWPTNAPVARIDGVLEEGKSSKFDITFSNAPPSSGSLWLSYLD